MRLAVMRPKDKLEESIVLAREMGFDVVAASPLQIEMNDGPEFDALLRALKNEEVDVAVLTSSTGVEALARMASRRGEDAAVLLSSCYRIAIGPLTAKAMAARGIGVDMIPEEYSSEGLVRQMGQELAYKRVHLMRSSHGERILYDGLVEAGAEVTETVLYELVPDPDAPEVRYLVDESMAGKVDAFAFSSSLSAASFIDAAEKVASREKVIDMLNSRVVGAMGGPTRKRLEQMGIRVTAVPVNATFRDLLESISASIPR
ncbi:MAG: uroporphyrinogen-III synthase [Methanomassiliicoccus sp.]|nr:uroporphyrinogen-III synthase [Methanomassiliicoccus sp.]